MLDENVIEETTPEEAPVATEEPITSEVVTPPGTPPEPDEPPEIPSEYSEKVQRRIDKLTKNYREAEREAAYWKGKAEAGEKPAGTPAPTVTPATAKPREEDFDVYNDYIEALTDWKAEQTKAEWDAEQQRKREEDDLSATQQSFQEKMQVGYEKYDDFHEVAFSTSNPINAIMFDAIAGSEIPADIAYYLGSHIHECTNISRMPAIQAARAIGAIEEKLRVAEATNPPPKAKNPKPPPEPITPVGGGGPAIVTKDPDKMTNEEYRAARERGEI